MALRWTHDGTSVLKTLKPTDDLLLYNKGMAVV